MKRKICKNCKLFVEGGECPICKSTNFLQSWKGRIAVVDFSRSQIAAKIGIKANGEYAIKAK